MKLTCDKCKKKFNELQEFNIKNNFIWVGKITGATAHLCNECLKDMKEFINEIE